MNQPRGHIGQQLAAHRFAVEPAIVALLEQRQCRLPYADDGIVVTLGSATSVILDTGCRAGALWSTTGL
jgi:hypothetical protein